MIEMHNIYSCFVLPDPRINSGMRIRLNLHIFRARIRGFFSEVLIRNQFFSPDPWKKFYLHIEHEHVVVHILISICWWIFYFISEKNCWKDKDYFIYKYISFISRMQCRVAGKRQINCKKRTQISRNKHNIYQL